MSEFNLMARILGTAAIGFMVIGQVLAGEIYLWFGWRIIGPVEWFQEVVAHSF